ncbi:hemerythrin domain-containing protein [Arthrobacter wenxiniae]|jgi:regulator of cell morphogenesis and NO signaling|uniref:Hemerythrin domain-containing protein n=1 Tax=Arthrobacter wenxiniae TaxID=2713570 RepID=A0A7Y7IJ15_9MICC|nr:hemerythrin domain-containing protein [Arthrobacter wenxiniae]NVM96362.1 hemerythrin domain-containing protein [Arthrobacter wenxiniae]
MDVNTLGGALEREHRQIDGGIEAYLNSLDGPADPAPLLAALTGLRRHIYLEEQFLFPPLKAAGLMGPIFVMLREHGQLWTSMDAVEQLLADGADPDARRDACTALLSLLDAHNSKEEPIIYTQADAILSAEAGSALQEFLAGGTTPDGWVCSGASR